MAGSYCEQAHTTARRCHGDAVISTRRCEIRYVGHWPTWQRGHTNQWHHKATPTSPSAVALQRQRIGGNQWHQLSDLLPLPYSRTVPSTNTNSRHSVTECGIIEDPKSSANTGQRSVTKPLISPREVRDGLLSFSSKLLSSYVLAENTRILVHKTIILSTIVWVCTWFCTPEGRTSIEGETCSFTHPWKFHFYFIYGDSRLFRNVSNYLLDYSEDRFRASGNGMLKKIGLYGPIGGEVKQRWRKLHQLHTLHPSLDVTKPRTIRLVWYVARMGEMRIWKALSKYDTLVAEA